MTRRGLIVLAIVCLAGAAALRSQPSRGVVIEQLDAVGAASKSGLQVGDVIERWSRDAVTGAFDTPFTVAAVETEEGDRGAVTVIGFRGGEPRTWTLPAAPWGVNARPAFGQALLSDYQTSAALTAASPATAAAQLSELAARLADPAQSAWVFVAAAQAAFRAQDGNGVDRAFAAALERTTGAPAMAVAVRRAWADAYFRRSLWKEAEQHLHLAIEEQRRIAQASLIEGRLLYELGRVFGNRGEFALAERRFREADAIQARLAPDSLGRASSLQGIGSALSDQGKLIDAPRFHNQALAIRERKTPGSMDVAVSLHNLGRVSQELGQVDDAWSYYRRSLAISGTLVPRGAQWASTMNNLGNVARVQGDIDGAERYLTNALTARSTLRPDSLDVAQTLTNLSTIAHLRGDFGRADGYLRRAIEIYQRLAPGTARIQSAFENFAQLYTARRDWALAADYLQQALTLAERSAPDTLYHARVMASLGTIEHLRGNLQLAERYQQQALAMKTRNQADPMFAGESLHALGMIAEARNDLPLAATYYQRALAPARQHSGDSVQVSAILHSLGGVARRQRKWDLARRYYEESLAIRGRLVPGTIRHAEALHAMGVVETHGGNATRAVALFAQALDAFDAQTARLASPEDVSAGFRASYASFYRDYVDLLLRERRPADAFDVLERTRSRLVGEMLGARQLTFAEVPAELRLRSRRIAADYDRTQEEMAQRASAGRKDVEALAARIRQLSAERAAVSEQIRHAAPRVAGLQYAQALDLAAARAALDAGTVALSYAVTETRVLLFVIQPTGVEPGISVFPIATTERALRTQVDALRTAIQTRTPAGRRAFEQHARAAFTLLVTPAAKLIERANRVLVIPDGPLHALPFAALIAPTGKYFVAWRAVHTAPSVTVYADARRRGADTTPYDADFIGFGAPIYPDQASAAAVIERSMLRGRSFAPLAFSRSEVEGIAGRFGSRGRVLAGPDATETNALSLPPRVRYLHFAVHGLLDEQFPLNSALALTIPAQPGESNDNGLLQAWELYERARWDVDLVVLSACESALGKEFAGEGLLGLTRAIQFAGARSVMASLWSVDDRRTARLMDRFYAHLQGGLTKDEALRAAQLEFIASADDAPFHWAAFTLTGDWR